MSTRSPSGASCVLTGSTVLGTGVLSPVRPASSISSVAATRMRPSAGTLSPASNPTMSPGTSSSAGISSSWPSRRTLAVMISICRRAATLSAALPSWCKPITALTTVSPITTRPVETSWSATMLITAAPRSTSCMRSRYWRRNARQLGSLASSARRLGPNRARRATTSPALRPTARSTSRRWQTSSALRWYQSGGSSTGDAVFSVAAIRRSIDPRRCRRRGPASRSRRDRIRALAGPSWSRRSPRVGTSVDSAPAAIADGGADSGGRSPPGDG